ncbi:HAD-IIB family hydrolase [Coprobacillaceae bacterium CR2/5/TPMF4]|nr:HAD-IIB family hydrolase [Coprobacillaceae bacterium CR2/5/TPMF4]
MKEKIQSHFNNCTITQSSNNLIEIMDQNVNKGTAIKKLCELWQIPLDNTIAFGDQYNDLEMLRIVKYGYAMENASKNIQDQVKE